MDEKKQIDTLHELISKYHEAWKHGEGDWKRGLAECIVDAGYRKQSVGEWKDNHCTNCGMMPLGEEMWTRLDLTPPKFEWFMNYCPNCGARMKGGEA